MSSFFFFFLAHCWGVRLCAAVVVCVTPIYITTHTSTVRLPSKIYNVVYNSLFSI